MHGVVVGVLRGGPSSEHDISLKTGHAILTSLPIDQFTPRDIFIDRAGVWHEKGRPVAPENILRGLDVVVLGLHGAYGEDGKVQRLLEQHGVPYTGSDHLSSHFAMHKVLAKEKAIAAGLKTPRYRFIESADTLHATVGDAVRSFLQPVVVKPVASGSSVGVALAHGSAAVLEAAQKLLDEGSGVLIEERIRGREATVGVVEGLRGEELYGLPPIEIIPPPSRDFFDFEAKYGGESQEICPERFPRAVKNQLMKQAKDIHTALGLRHYSRSDFIVSPRGIYYLETNTLPGLTEQSLLPKSLEAIGVKFPDFLAHLIASALKK